MAQRRSRIPMPTLTTTAQKIKTAVALSYDPKEEAPKIIASGRGILADKIVEKAKEEAIPIHQDERLTNTLSKLEIGEFIPPELYEAVAEVLIFVDRMDKIKSKLWYSKRKEEKIKQNRRKLGNEKETLAASFLIQQGFELLERNFSCQSGEIDLILREGIELVFTEVKYRSNCSYGFPQEAVNKKKQHKMIHTANYYLFQKKISQDTPCRFDVVAILGEEIILIRNAF